MDSLSPQAWMQEQIDIVKYLTAHPRAKASEICEQTGARRASVAIVVHTLKLRMEERLEQVTEEYKKMLLERLPLEIRADVIAEIAELRTKDPRAALAAIEAADKLGRLRQDRIDATLSNPDGTPLLTGIKVIEVGKPE